MNRLIKIFFLIPLNLSLGSIPPTYNKPKIFDGSICDYSPPLSGEMNVYILLNKEKLLKSINNKGLNPPFDRVVLNGKLLGYAANYKHNIYGWSYQSGLLSREKLNVLKDIQTTLSTRDALTEFISQYKKYIIQNKFNQTEKFHIINTIHNFSKYIYLYPFSKEDKSSLTKLLLRTIYLNNEINNLLISDTTKHMPIGYSHIMPFLPMENLKLLIASKDTPAELRFKAISYLKSKEYDDKMASMHLDTNIKTSCILSYPTNYTNTSITDHHSAFRSLSSLSPFLHLIEFIEENANRECCKIDLLHELKSLDNYLQNNPGTIIEYIKNNNEIYLPLLCSYVYHSSISSTQKHKLFSDLFNLFLPLDDSVPLSLPNENFENRILPLLNYGSQFIELDELDKYNSRLKQYNSQSSYTFQAIIDLKSENSPYTFF